LLAVARGIHFLDVGRGKHSLRVVRAALGLAVI
jgi:hypothetical protein